MSTEGENAFLDETQSYIAKMDAIMHSKEDSGTAENQDAASIHSSHSENSVKENGASLAEEDNGSTYLNDGAASEHSGAEDQNSEDKPEDYGYEAMTDAAASVYQGEDKSAQQYYRENGYDDSKKEELETYEGEPEEDQNLAARNMNDQDYTYHAREDTETSGIIRAKPPHEYYKDADYDAVIAEMSKKKMTPEEIEEVLSSRRSSVASKISSVVSRRESNASEALEEAPLSREGSIVSKASSRRASNVSLPREPVLSRSGSIASKTGSNMSRRQSSASIAQEDEAGSRRSSVALSRRESASSLVERESVGSRRESVSSRRDSTGTLVPDEEILDDPEQPIVNGSISSRRESTISLVENWNKDLSSRRSSVASKKESRRSSVASNVNGEGGEGMVSSQSSRRSSAVSITIPVPQPRKIVVENAEYNTEHEEAFEQRVRQSISEYKSEKNRSNAEVLEKIGQETDEGNIDVKGLLAWAKATNKKDTESMVVRKKQHVDKIKRASDFSLASVFLATKEAIKEEEPEPVAPATPAIRKKEEKAQPKQEVLIREHEVQAFARQLINPNLMAVNINIKEKNEDSADVSFDGEVDRKMKTFQWTVVRSSSMKNQEKVVSSLQLIEGAVTGTKMSVVNMSKTLYSDLKITIVDESSDYVSLPVDTQLDEIHLKVGMKALARLHALSYLYFKRNPGLQTNFINSSFTEANNRSNVKEELDNRMLNISAVLEKVGHEALLNNINSLKTSVFNIYREANTSPSVIPCLAHGECTLANLEFKYFDSLPTDARFKNFDDSSFGSGISDLHTFINTSGDNIAREDFLLRFVYYETLASLFKSQGEKINFSYDDMKTEFVQKKLHGYINSASILAGGSEVGEKKAVKKEQAVVQKVPTRPVSMKPIESKILGTFNNATLGAKIIAVNSFTNPPAAEEMNGDKKEPVPEDQLKFPADRITVILQKALKAH